MKIRPLKTGSLSLLFSLTALAVCVTAIAQLSETPPVKMGLWQTESNSTVTGTENTPMAAMAAKMAGQTRKSQSCLTPESWKEGIEGFNDKQRKGSCTLSNVQQDAHEVSFDQVCDSGGGSKNTTHMHMLIDSAEHAHGTLVMKMETPSFPQPITINVNLVSQYLGSSCGDVKPGEGKVIH